MTLVLSNDDVAKALNIDDCLKIMEESYREQAASRAVNRPTCHSYLPHSMANSTYSFKSVDGGVGKVRRARLAHYLGRRSGTGSSRRGAAGKVAARGKRHVRRLGAAF